MLDTKEYLFYARVYIAQRSVKDSRGWVLRNSDDLNDETHFSSAFVLSNAEGINSSQVKWGSCEYMQVFADYSSCLFYSFFIARAEYT